MENENITGKNTMEKAISSLELHYVIKELQVLADSKVDRIYQPEKDELVLQFHKTGSGKFMLRIVPGKYIYLTQYKQENPKSPFGYCIYLRKKLGNARLKTIQQIGFERIVEFVFETMDAKYRLYVEFFPRGNVVLADEQGIIMSPLQVQTWKDRIIRQGEKYIHPKQKYNLLEIRKEELKELLENSEKESIVKSLAIDLGLGGRHSEELCSIAKIKKEEKPSAAAADDKKIAAIMSGIKELLDKKMEMSRLLDEELAKELAARAGKEKDETRTTQIKKAENIIEMQTKQLKKIEAAVEENHKIGEAIYENYGVVENILKEIKNAKAKYSWEEIKRKLKDHKFIKEIKEKENKMVLEI